MRKNNLMKLLALAMTVVMFAAVLVSCGIFGGGETKVTVSISQETAKIAVGDTLQLTATVSDGSDVEWSSSDKTVVSVTRDGLIRGAKAGTATITAKSGEATATCVVTVHSVDVTISQTSATIEKGQTITLTAEAADGGEILWGSSDESIATVENGVVTGLKEGKVIITARRAQAGAAICEVTVVWTDKPDDYAVIGFGEEGPVAVANPGTYYYWNDQNWCGSSVTAVEAYYAGGVATFCYSDASPACWHGYQVFYKHAENVAGQAYKLSAKINSLEAGDITVNGTVVTLKKGDNNIEVYYVEDGGKASISIQMGNSAAGTVIAANTISISDIKFEEFTPEKLAVPTAVSISSDKVVSITDSNGEKANAIKLNFYKDGTMLYSFTLKDGEKLDDSIMEDGTYEIKAVAVGSGAYESSDESDVLATHTVSNGGVSYDMESLGEAGAAANPGKWTYWTEFSGITVAKYDNGIINFNVEVEGGNWYSNQLFYKNSALQAGKVYTLTMKMFSTVAGQITINGHVVTLVEGENQIEISANEGNVSISIQMGTMDSTGATASTIAVGEFQIQDIVFTEGAGSVDPETPNAAIAGGEVDAIANPDKLYYWTEFAGVANATYENGVISFNVVNGGNWYSNQIFLKNAELTAGKTYKLTLTIVSSVAEKITLNGAVIELGVGENAVEVTYVEDAAKASISLQCGVNGGVSLAAGEFTLKDITYTEVEGGGDEGGDDPVTPPADPSSYDIIFADEAGTMGNPGVWHFWNDQNWCGSNVVVSGAHYDLNSDTATFSYSGATTACWFGLQIFYENPDNVDGTTYKMTCVINSMYAGEITIKGQVVTLVAGENNIELIVVEGADINANDTPDASFVLQCGTLAGSVISENTISISGLTFTEVEGGGDEGGDDPVTPPDVPSTEIIFGGEVDAVANPGKAYYWTEWAGIADATYENGVISFKVVNGGNWYSNQIFLKNAELTAGKTYKLTLTIVSSVAEKITLNGNVVELVVGENAVEVTYVEDAAKASISLQCGINSGVSLAAGEFTLKDITYTEVEGGGDEGGDDPVTPPDTSSSYDIVFADENGSISDPGVWHFWNDQNWCGSTVTVSAAHYDAEADKATLTYSMEGFCWFGMQIFYDSSAQENGKTYKLTCTINSEAAGDVLINGQVVTLVVGENNIELTFVKGVDYDDTPDASFALQCGNPDANTAITANTIAISGLTFTEVEGGNEGDDGEEGGDDPVTPPETSSSYDIVFGEEGVSVANPGVWYFWNDQNWCGTNVVVSASHYDAEADKATFTYSGAANNCWFGMQIFYKNSSNAVGQKYKLTCTIISDVAGDITINTQVVTLVAGENNIELIVTESAAASFKLQCGNETAATVIPAGTISISGLTFTEYVEEGGEDGGEDPVTPPATPATSYDILFGAEGDSAAKPGVWCYWNDQNWVGSNVTVSYAYYDAEADKATFTYSGATTACWHGMQIFFREPANVEGKTYKLTCTITSEVAGDITIVGNVITLVAGENNIELTVGQGGASSFALQCGNVQTGTVIEANTISISNLTFTEI